jgi:pyruvate dehydrogenase E1 component alpha subunit
MNEAEKKSQILDEEIALKIYKKLYEIRRVEERIAESYPDQEMRCPVHFSIGQEACAVGVSEFLNNEDHVYSTHRCHGHYLAKGGNLPAMIAELYGKKDGCASGKGGSMHLIDIEVGMMGASAIVGGSIPLALGSALTYQLQGKQNVAVAFFGDGASEQGVFYESLQFASLRNLPVIFVCENNLYATYSSIQNRQPLDNIFERAKFSNIPGFRIDGNKILDILEISKNAIARARNGEGPTLIECRTYRWLDHVGPNEDIDIGYRTREELDSWIGNCPVKSFENYLIKNRVLEENKLRNVQSIVEQNISDAFDFAKNSPFPSEEELFEGIY